MHLPTPHFRPLPLYAKIASIFIIGAFLVIGVIGLILPVIPGVLFLFLAVLLTTRVSRRASQAAHSSAWFRQHMHTWQTSSRLPLGRKLALSGLLLVKGMLSAVRAAAGLLKRSVTR
ncbi:DUF454 family protein [Pseudohongiella spirulinae]|uniref:Transmembrane protein n=1 Tax=Pseudohongiella spirulinae TaxID=1249552 RepID=A0A0S2KBC6_9GAMM|nr:DUF454 family protein [Pseudohongiella spirulinae]ALO45627.1 hypothetical protein PS2015_957 [Pseudohongiella spirulinae]